MRETAPIQDCWNKIGVWGNAECPELVTQVHCRNCPVYSAASARMLNGEAPADYVLEWTSLVAQERNDVDARVHSVIIFRLGPEWLALATSVFKEVAEIKPVHTLPHRRSSLVRGLVNIRGELLVCVSLAHALGLEMETEAEQEKKHEVRRRLLVISEEGRRLVFPVDEVGGIHQFAPLERKEVPATLNGAAATHTSGWLTWRNKSVGCLDEQLLFYTLNQGLA